MRPRRPPELVVRVPLEGAGRIVIAADTFEDELRLRAWLRRSRALDDLAVVLVRLLDELDERDRSAA